MASERIQRRIESLLDRADEAFPQEEWQQALELAKDALALDGDNGDAKSFIAAAERRLEDSNATDIEPPSQTSEPSLPLSPTSDQPSSFANDRYNVKRFLGEGGKKRVYLAHDNLLDRDVAFALIKTEGLDDTSRERIKREAQAMGRLGSHPHIVTVLDLGDHEGQPYMVIELLAGGDVEGLIEDAENNRLSLPPA